MSHVTVIVIVINNTNLAHHMFLKFQRLKIPNKFDPPKALKSRNLYYNPLLLLTTYYLPISAINPQF